MEWIKHQIDSLVGFGPGTIVLGLGLVVVAIPIGILAVYVMDRARRRKLDSTGR